MTCLAVLRQIPQLASENCQLISSLPKQRKIYATFLFCWCSSSFFPSFLFLLHKSHWAFFFFILDKINLLIGFPCIQVKEHVNVNATICLIYYLTL